MRLWRYNTTEHPGSGTFDLFFGWIRCDNAGWLMRPLPSYCCFFYLGDCFWGHYCQLMYVHVYVMYMCMYMCICKYIHLYNVYQCHKHLFPTLYCCLPSPRDALGIPTFNSFYFSRAHPIMIGGVHEALANRYTSFDTSHHFTTRITSLPTYQI